VWLTGAAGALGQGRAEDWQRAETLPERLAPLIQRFQPRWIWLPEGKGVAGRDSKAPSSGFWVVDAKSGERTAVASLAEWGVPSGEARLEPLRAGASSEPGGEPTEVEFHNDFGFAVRLFWMDTQGKAHAYGTLGPGERRVQPTYAGHVWLADVQANDLVGVFRAQAWAGKARFDAASREAAHTPVATPQPKALVSGRTLFLRDHNLWVRSAEGETQPLTQDGTPEDPYAESWVPAPDGTRVLAFRETVVETRRIALIDSSPSDQVQPRVVWLDYPKPGDPVPQRRPRIVDLELLELLPADDGLWKDSYQITDVHWAPDSSRVHCLYRVRGHQRVVLRAIDAHSGAVTDLVDERSETFLDDTQKTVLHWLDARGELLWGSERSGYQHLYRIDSRTGKVLNAVTQGPFVVRRLDHVDEANGQVWLGVMGIHPDEDPYHEHLVRVDLDGSHLRVLTAGDGTHRWDFSPDRSLWIDTWSRVDLPAVSVLRRASDGGQVAELGRDDASAWEAQGIPWPERFVAKGRDGVTDIYGIVIGPTHPEAGRTYPVIETIYAGPHDFHVPKAFDFLWQERQLAELGFVVVRIDGMGTNWRSKAFHDVCWQNLADAGLPDRVAWIRAAAERFPFMDIQRVGIFGGSAGGQNALAALLHHGDFYRAGAADCGCHDNRMDKLWWNEAWMGVLGPHYAANSNVTHAAKLQGDLLLTVGELDRNVDPSSTLQVVRALLAAGKRFEWLVVPGAGHGVGERLDMARRRSEFFVRTLYPQSSR